MEDTYITEVLIKEVRNIKNFKIPLNSDKRQNLIITGKNGTGKTSLLAEINKFLVAIVDGSLKLFSGQMDRLNSLKHDLAEYSRPGVDRPATVLSLNKAISELEQWISRYGGTYLNIKSSESAFDYYVKGDFIIAYFPAKRNTGLAIPTGIKKINFKKNYQIGDLARQDFIQYIVNLKADRSFARDDGDQFAINKIDQWFGEFEESLFSLFDSMDIKLEFDRKNYNFVLHEKDKRPYNLNQLSDGYSSILTIVTELIMRMEEHRTKNYDVQGIVLIDEIETHLHIELQKKVLPFLVSFFPKIQFIVTTHSPFVISSIQNAVICDLEKRIVTTDLTGYSYDTIIESYFESDKYSDELKERLSRFDLLSERKDLTEVEKNELTELKGYFNDIPKFLSDELVVRLQQIKLRDIKK